MELKELKKFGYKEKVVYDTAQDILQYFEQESLAGFSH